MKKNLYIHLLWTIVILIIASCHSKVQVEDYHPVVRSHPSIADSWHNAGIAYMISGQDSLALEAFGRAVELNPRDGEGWFNMGAIYALTEQQEPALKAFTEAFRLPPPAHLKHLVKGLALYTLGRFSEAIPEFRESIGAHEAHTITAIVKLGFSLYALERYAEGIEAFTLASRSNPAAAELYNTMFFTGYGYQMLGRHTEAIDAYRRSIMTRPDFSQAYFNLGIEFLAVGDPAGAKEQAAALMQLSPELAKNLESYIRSAGKSAPGDVRR